MYALREPDFIQYTWLIGERVSAALDFGPKVTSSVYFNDKVLGTSVAEHETISAANAEVARLVGGGWRDYFDDNPELLAELDAEAIK